MFIWETFPCLSKIKSLLFVYLLSESRRDFFPTRIDHSLLLKRSTVKLIEIVRDVFGL